MPRHHHVLALVALVGCLAPAVGSAHPLAPSLLDVREVRAHELELTWRTPIQRAPGSALAPLVPAGCTLGTTHPLRTVATALEARWTLACADASLVGTRLGASDIAASGADVLLRVTLADGRRYQTVLTPEAPTFDVPARESAFEIVRAYATLGLWHILGGVDHLVFVLGLVLLVRRRRSLVATVTAFTVGHSVTLSLAVLGIVRIPQAPAEAAIAVSIFVLALELARATDGTPGLLGRRPQGMAAGFGLLHGLGFAGALAAAGLPQDDIPLALASFNVGIELGQLAFVLVVTALRTVAGSIAWRRPQPFALLPAYAIGSLAVFWILDRTAPLVRTVLG